MTALILYPNQLFDYELLPKVSRVYLVEEPLFFGVDDERPIAYHKQKLVLHRASMRRYAEEVLWPNGFEVEYVECGADTVTDTAIVKAAFDGAGEIVVFDPGDDLLWSRIQSAAGALEVHVPLRRLENPNFYLKSGDIEEYFAGKDKSGFDEFYQYMRERFDVLIDEDYRPFGGKWSYETKSRKKLSGSVVIPGISIYGDNQHVVEAMQYVESRFPANPGTTSTFLWPTNKAEALAWMAEFFATRLEKFGPYLSAIDSSAVWVFHSALSPVMNCGLLSSREVVDAALDYVAKSKKDIPLESLESFVRQILGKREYARALYVAKKLGIDSITGTRRLTNAWYRGETGLPPLDDMVKKTLDFGYAHEVERAKIAGNLMLLCDVAEGDIYRWFMAMFVDSYEWIVTSSLYSLSTFASDKATKEASIVASNFVLTNGNYTKDRWCDIWDGLYWRYVDTHRGSLKKSTRVGSVLVNRYDHMDSARRRIIGYRADDFLDTCAPE
jgi:deoxyribodipyrimidine photolyase-related protein